MVETLAKLSERSRQHFQLLLFLVRRSPHYKKVTANS